jgi:D-alanyl-D-alanine carboxypeptidase
VIDLRKLKKIRLKTKFKKILKIVGIVFLIFICLFIFYLKQINDLTSLGYSKIASKNILFSFKKSYILDVGENATLNRAYEGTDLNEEYLDYYKKIKFVDQEHLIKNINKLIKIGYTTSDINIILSHGDDDSVTRFTKHEKVKYLEEFFSVSYAKLDYYDRYVNYSDETGEDDETTVLYVNLNLDKEDYEDAVEVTDFSSDMVVNKHRYLSEDFEPDDLTKIPSKYASEAGMTCSRLALNAFIKMYNAAKSEDLDLVINSAYRSYQDQEDTSNYYLELYGQTYVDRYVAKPGFSEHQTGLSFDIGSRSSNVFANSDEYKWMLENAYKYGFILRYSDSNSNITGFRGEKWHFRYVGDKIAKYIYENDITLEEYFVMFLDN